MRKYLLALIWIISIPVLALHVECVGLGERTQLTHQGDTLLVFEKEPALKIKGLKGAVSVYNLYPDSNKIAFETSDIDKAGEFYPEHGQGYILKQGDLREVFWVFDYDSLRVQANAVTVTAELTCENTVLTIDGNIPPLQYHNQNGRLTTYPRMCRVEYTDAMWSENVWVDSTAIEEVGFATTITVGASPVATDFAISDVLAQQLGLSVDTLYSPEYQPVALKAHPQTITTTRGQSGEYTNEVDRPFSPDDVLNMSAPLEVLFKSNGLNAEYYEWHIYKGSERLLSRKDAEHRYTFMEKGSYRAVVLVSNDYCQLDSAEFTISISESMLVVPNVFTPNGDGANDEFRVAYRSLKEFHCWVYNRWGHLVYHTTNPDKGWDGTIGGRPAAEGAYFYVIRALGTDADENAKYTIKPVYTSKLKKQDETLIGVYQLSGSINLLRGGKQ